MFIRIPFGFSVYCQQYLESSEQNVSMSLINELKETSPDEFKIYLSIHYKKGM